MRKRWLATDPVPVHVIAPWEEADKAHARPRIGHKITREDSTQAGMPVNRAVCTCGWRGEWYRSVK